MTTTCPSDAELRELLLGRGPDTVGDHLLDCPKCGAKAGQLVASDPLLSDLRAANDTSELGSDGTFVEELLKRVRKAPAKPVDKELDFLDPPSKEHPDDLGRFNHYRIVQKIGQGGMGMVFKAVDTTLDRTVALKIILPRYAENTKLRDRFIEEAKATVKVRSPHVAEIYEINVWRNVPYLTMELLVGTTLDKRPKPMALDALRRIGFSIAKGLSDAHRSGLIHRDLKPSNIHLGTDARTGKPTVKLIDFGLARPVNRDIEITKSGELLGTPAYMSPEQARGKKVDHRTDLYSLGVILHQLATGKLPYDSANEGVMAILTELATPEPLTSVAKRTEKLPPSLAKLIDRLLSKDAANRPASADEVMKILKESLNERVDPNASSTGTAIAESAPYVSISDSTGPYEPSMLFSEMKTEPDERPVAKPARRWVWPAVGVGVAVAALVVAILAGAFNVKVKTKDGPVIELADLPDDAEVTVDGEVVKVSWNEGKTKAEVSVKPGTRTIEVKKDGFRVTGEEITLAEGERKPFTVRLEKLELGEKPAAELVAAVPSVVTSAELVVNGNADDRLKGWESKDGNWNVMGPEVRDPFFRPGRCKNAVLQQDVDVANYAADIDAGLVEFKFSGLISCYSKGQKDKASLRLVFLDTDKKELGTGYDTGFVHESVWKEYGGTPKPKVGTRYVRIILHSRRDNTLGNYENSGYYDNISLKALTTKLPATFAKLRPAANGSTVQFFGTGFLPQADFVTGPEAYANVLMMGVSTDSQTFIDAARRASRTVVLLFQGKARDGIESSLYPILDKNRDTVAGVFWSLPYANGYDPAAVASFGRDLKQKFPGLTYLVSFVEKPNGKHETKPVPEEVDVVVVTNYFDKTPANVQAKTDDCLPVWAAKAGGRPIYLLWTNWDNNATGIVPSTQPGTFRACLEAAKKHRIAGILFHALYSGTTQGMKSIDANPPLYQELVEVGRAIGGANGATGPNAPSGLVATVPAAAGGSNDRNRFNVRKGQWSIVGDELAQTDAGEHYGLLEFGDENWTDYDYQVDVKRVSGNDQAALLSRWTSPSNFNLFGIGTSGNSFVVVEWQKDGQIGYLNNFNYRLNNNQWYTMLVKVRGNRMTCELRHGADKVRSWVADSDRHPRGKVGLRTAFSHYRFRNIKVTAPDGKVLWDGLPNIGGAPATAPPAAATTPSDGPTFTNALGMKFVRVPKGTVPLGGRDGNPGNRNATVDADFYLGTYEVTQEEWRTVMGTVPALIPRPSSVAQDLSPEAQKRFPVNSVTWHECREFAKKLNERLKEPGWEYRLPTEKEWEYACRGGPGQPRAAYGYKYYAGEPSNTLAAGQANFGDSLKNPCPVGKYAPNKLGLYDMHGNVGEWCDDVYVPPLRDASGNEARVNRGGSHWESASYCDINWQSRWTPNERHRHVGLRIARVPIPGFVPNALKANARTVDLLALVDVSRDAVKGTWTRGPDGITSDNSAYCRIKIPYQPLPAEYDYRVEFTAKGAGNDILQLLSAGGTSFSFLMGAWGGKWDGFDAVTGHPLTRAGTNIIGGPTSIKARTRHTVVISVRKDSVSATIDGKLVVKHATNYADLRMPNEWKIGDGLLGLGTTIDPTTFHKAELVEVTKTDGEPEPKADKGNSIPTAKVMISDFKNNIGIEFIRVPQGRAWIGGDLTKDGHVTVTFKDDYYIGKYEITQKEWQQIMGKNPSHFSRSGAGRSAVLNLSDEQVNRLPVESVSWKQCQDFIAKLNEITDESGWLYRLPTSNEWEYACRGGPMTVKSASRSDFAIDNNNNKPIITLANYRGTGIGRTSPVGTFESNRLGIHDMFGNVWEYLDDKRPEIGKRAGIGSSWKNDPLRINLSLGNLLSETAVGSDMGLRLVRVRIPIAVGKKKSDPNYSPLLNGKDLTGWEAVGNASATWKVENGELVGGWKNSDFVGGSTLETKRKDYRHFRLRVTAKPTENWPSRIFCLSPFQPTAREYFKVWIGTEKEEANRETGRLTLRANDAAPLLAKAKVAADAWNTIEIEVKGNRVQVFVDGVKTADQTDDRLPAAGNAIGLHLTGGSVLRVKGVEIEELKP